jgi:hypothetical protein
VEGLQGGAGSPFFPEIPQTYVKGPLGSSIYKYLQASIYKPLSTSPGNKRGKTLEMIFPW